MVIMIKDDREPATLAGPRAQRSGVAYNTTAAKPNGAVALPHHAVDTDHVSTA